MICYKTMNMLLLTIILQFRKKIVSLKTGISYAILNKINSVCESRWPIQAEDI